MLLSDSPLNTATEIAQGREFSEGCRVLVGASPLNHPAAKPGSLCAVAQWIIMHSRYRSPAILWRFALVLLVMGGAIADAAPAFAQGKRIGHSHCCGRQDVILIRGGAGYWPGAKDLEHYFQRLGYAPTVIQHWEYGRVAEEIEQAVQEGRMSGGVMLVGYSTGADTACWLADRLDKKGIRVNTMILMESTFGTAVPPNVGYCANYFDSRPFDLIPAFRGLPVVARSPHTELANINVGRHPGLKSLAQHNHFTLANSYRMHEIVAEVAVSRQPPSLILPSVEITAEVEAATTPPQR